LTVSCKTVFCFKEPLKSSSFPKPINMIMIQILPPWICGGVWNYHARLIIHLLLNYFSRLGLVDNGIF
jgi:hypothetical protein